jgi:hypothetical protein
MNIDVTFLSNLILGNDIKVCKTLVQEGCYIICFLKDFRINVVINKREKFLEDALYVFDFIQI